MALKKFFIENRSWVYRFQDKRSNLYHLSCLKFERRFVNGFFHGVNLSLVNDPYIADFRYSELPY